MSAEELQKLRERAAEGIRPVTIHQLLEATRPHSNDPFSIGGVVVDRVSLVAQVIEQREYDTSVSFHLEDGTKGPRMVARQWRDNKSYVANPLRIQDGQTYVHIIGELERKNTGYRNTLIVLSIQKITENLADRIFCHILEAAYATLCYERGPPPLAALESAEPRMFRYEGQPLLDGPHEVPTTPSKPRGHGAQSSDHPPSTPFSPLVSPPQSMRHPVPREQPLPSISFPQSPTPTRPDRPSTPEEPASPSPMRQQALLVPKSPSPVPWIASSEPETLPQGPQVPPRRASGMKKDPYAHLTVLQRAILLQMLNSRDSEEGSDVVNIVRGVSHHNVTAEAIGDALDFLTEEGYIETTIDSTHYAIKTSRYPVTRSA